MQLHLRRPICVLILAACFVAITSQAVEPRLAPGTDPLGNPTEEELNTELQKSIRINAYFINIPEFKPSCDELELLYENELIAGVPEKDRAAFQTLRRKGGSFEKQLEEVEKLRKALKPLHEDWLFAALDYHTEIRAYQASDHSFFSLEQKEWVDRQNELNKKVQEAYLFQLKGMVQLYMAESKLRSIARDYYTRVSQPPATTRPFRISFFDNEDPAIARKREAAKEPPKPSPFDGLTVAKQRKMLDAFQKRLQCLRDERLKAFHTLARNTIDLEISVSKYIEATRKEKVKIEDATRVDEANAQIERSVLQQTYLWLMEEFATHTAIYKILLFAHERKLRNTLLFDVQQKRQSANPFIAPASELPSDFPGLVDAQTQVAKTRARIALLTAMEEEAKLEAASVANASSTKYFVDTVQGEVSKWFQGIKSLNIWLRDNDSSYRDILVAGPAAFVGISYQFFSNSFNALLVTPLKDIAIKQARNTNWVDGWKTTTKDNYEKYLQAAGQFSPRMKYLEGLQQNMSSGRARQILNEIKSGPGETLKDLLTDHTFVSATQGGMAYVLEPLCDNTTDHKALWLHCAVEALSGAFNNARDRIAAARGIEIENPLADASVTDIRLGASSVLNEGTDVLFKIPSMWKNFVGQYTSAYQDQQDLMIELQSQLGIARRVVKLMEAGDVNYSPEKLRRKNQSAYQSYIGLTQTCLQFNHADYTIQQKAWNRAKGFNLMVSKLKDRNSRFEGEVALSELQRQEEARFAAMAVRQGFLKLKYMIHTANYSAAVLQAKKLEELENIRRKTQGIEALADYKALAAELHLLAVSNQAVVAWEGLLNQAITTVITSKISTLMHERVLSRFDKKWLEAYQANLKKVSVSSELFNTFVPWTKVYSASGVLDLVVDTGTDLVKSQIAEEIAEAANAYWYQKPGYAEGTDYEALVGQVFDLGNALRQQLQEIAITNYAMKRVDTYANKETYDAALEVANKARDDMKGAFLAADIGDGENHAKNTIKDLFDEDFQNLSPEQKNQYIEATVANEGGSIRLELTRQAYARYRLAMIDLETEHAAYQERLKKINSVLFYGMKVSKSLENAMGELQKMQWDAYSNLGRSRVQAGAIGRAVSGTEDLLFHVLPRSELRTRMLQGAHSIEDLEAMVSNDANTNLNMPKLLLRRSDDIDVIRRALKVSMDDAIARKGGSNPRKNNPDLERVKRVAEAIDEIRVQKINSLLAEFMDASGHGDKVEMVIQGGAATGNPEYQGIFGDIDFTLMLKGHAVGESDQIKEELLVFFEKAGYPLARSKEDPSSMDSEAFVQPFDRFDTAQAGLAEAVKDIVEKNKDPTRFYSEGGSEWFINNAAYSGMLLWPRGNQKVQWVNVDPSRGHGLAIDMSRYLGFLASPKYTKAYLAAHPDKRREYLETALGKGKYFIRLIDAYEIGHPSGNIEYNKRKDIVQNEPRDKSYHWQIFEDAKKIIDNPDPNDPNPVFTRTDLDYIEVIAMMKLKGDYGSPWEAIQEKFSGLDEVQQLAKAQETVDWMRDKAPKIFAYLGDRWHQTAEQRGRSSNPQDRAFLQAEKFRKMSTVKAVMQNDGPDSVVFLVPKEVNGEQLDQQAHANEIARRINAAAGVTPLSAEIETAVSNRDPADPNGDTARASVSRAIQQSKARATITPEGMDIFAIDNQFRNWLSYMANAGTGAN